MYVAFWEPFNLGYVGECARLDISHAVFNKMMDASCASVSKFKLYFNLGFVGVSVRCFSLDTVAGIARRSWPRLGLSEGRDSDNLTHWLISTQFRTVQRRILQVLRRAEVDELDVAAPACDMRVT